MAHAPCGIDLRFQSGLQDRGHFARNLRRKGRTGNADCAALRHQAQFEHVFEVTRCGRIGQSLERRSPACLAGRVENQVLLELH